MKLDMLSKDVYFIARNEAKLKSHEYITPEHYLYSALMFDVGKQIIENSGGNADKITSDLNTFFKEQFEEKYTKDPVDSFMLSKMFELCAAQAVNSEKSEITLGDVLVSILSLPESFAAYSMLQNGVKKILLLRYISHNMKSSGEKIGLNNKNDSTSKKQQKSLDKYAVNLTEMAKEGKLDPLIGREDILERTIQVLLRRLKNNPIHVGEAGVGKTSIIEGLAQKIVDGDVPKSLKNYNIYYIDMGNIVAGTKYRGDFEDRLINVLDEAADKGNSIVYIDEVHDIVGAGAVSSGSMDAASILKPYLSKGALKFIGSTTYDEYKKHFEKDNALLRRFQKINVEEPSFDESVEILKGLRQKYEDFHNVEYSDSVIEITCKLCQKHMTDRKMPDKAIDVIDETGAFLRMKSDDDERIIATIEDIEKTISIMAGTPEDTISHDDVVVLKNLDATMKKNIYGQDKAIEAVSSAIKISRSGLGDENKPIASLLFVGPTGVGKTEVSKQLAAGLNLKLIRFDMSEYKESHSIARLIGSPPGYVGYEEGGLLTDAIRQTPHSVLLLDEIEKAHKDIMNVLLQVMDYGVLTDNSGKKADFRNTIIIMTSNAGARDIGKQLIGFGNENITLDAINNAVDKEFSPEFRNRLTDIIIFNHIDEKMAELITKKEIDKLKNKLENKNITLSVSDYLLSWIAEKGLSEKYGAREILRIIEQEIKKLLVDKILFEDYNNKKIVLDFVDDNITVE